MIDQVSNAAGKTNSPALSNVKAMRFGNLETKGFMLEQDTLHHISLINMFIGENNAGKSRFLRELFKTQVQQLDIGSDLRGNLKQHLESQVDSRDSSAVIILEGMPNSPMDSELSSWLTELIENFCYKPTNNGRSLNSEDVHFEKTKTIGDKFLKDLYSLKETTSIILNNVKNREYIPILRGLRPLSQENDVYKERTKTDYFKSPTDKSLIYTGFSLYSDLTHALLGLESDRKSVQDFQDYLSKHFFKGKQVTLIPKKDRDEVEKPNDVVYVKIGSDQERPIYQLGDGIQAIITLMVRPFLTQEPTVFFIEEPEQHLHAGMQRALIQAFRACSRHKYFFTTQSNHFIDLSLETNDISLFSVKKIDDKGTTKSQIINQHDRSKILKDLGVLASSVLLANCSIWVEGITDKLYLRVYLQRFLDDLQESDVERHKRLVSFNENLHYVFVEYQGSNISHWDFSENTKQPEQTPANRLSNNILLIADNDIKDKGDRVSRLEAGLVDNFQLLDWKEIENYIPQDIIVKTANALWGKFTAKDKGDSTLKLTSIPNNVFESNSKGIGKILEDYIVKAENAKEGRLFFKEKSGTIKDKMKFCRTACGIMSDDDDWVLTSELKELCNKIWQFIEDHNKI